MGKHKKGDRVISFWLSPEQMKKLEEVQRLTGMTKTEIIKAAILAEAKRQGVKTDEAENHDNH